MAINDPIAAVRLTYRINELAAMIGVSIKTLDRMRRDGTFPDLIRLRVGYFYGKKRRLISGSTGNGSPARRFRLEIRVSECDLDGLRGTSHAQVSLASLTYPSNRHCRTKTRA